MKTFTFIALAVLSLTLISCIPAEPSLRILTEDYPPFNFISADKKVTGQSTEIVQEILKKLGKPEADIEVKPLAEGLALAEQGPAVAIYSINRTSQRENRFKWVGSIGAYEQALYARKGSGLTITSLDQAKEINGLIAVYKGDAGNNYLRSEGFLNLQESDDDAQALKSLVEGKADLWLGNREGLIVSAAEAGVKAEDLEMLVPVMRSELYIAFSKDTADTTIRAWQDALDSLKTVKGPDGRTVFENITQKYADAGYLRQVMLK